MLFSRRVSFAIIVLASQFLLIALAVTWLIQLLAIARNGSIQFVEENPFILLAEIILAALIGAFAIIVLFPQIVKLGEKRSGDRR